ncbi:MAG: ASCH domain-containing protein [Mediterranea sp.]|nr:ASCH domain-containing protein [Mediterranea sp.]
MEKKTNIRKYLFISVKPEFANKIVTKEKTVELRKIKPHVNIGDYIIIYASSPIKSVIGYGIIKQIIEKTPQRMWNEHSKFLGIDKDRFDEYYAGKEKSIGIEIHKIKKVKPIPLESLRTIDPNFSPPQVYRYVSNYIVNRTIINFIDKK